MCHLPQAYDSSAGGREALSPRTRFILADKPKPWVSEASGVSIQYAAGQPLGMLLAAVHDPEVAKAGNDSSLRTFEPIGAEALWKIPRSGTIYFRINDLWSDLKNNQGAVDVKVVPTSQ